MNHNSKIREGIEGWQEAPVSGREKTIVALRQRRSRSLLPAFASLAVMTAVVLTAVMPRESLANSLAQIQAAGEASANVVEQNWSVNAEGKSVLSEEIKRIDGKFRMASLDAATQYFDGTRVTNDFGTYATVETKKMRSGPAISLDNLLKLEGVKHWEVTHRFASELGSVDRYVIEWDTAGRSGKIELLADPATRRPLRELGLSGNSVGLKYTWTYGTVTPQQVAFQPVAGKPLFDIDAQRADFLARLDASKGTPAKPQVIAAYRDIEGSLVAFVVGDRGFSDDTQSELVVDNHVGDPYRIPFNSSVSGWTAPVQYKDKLVTARGITLKNYTVGRLATIAVRIGGTLNSFDQVPVIQTGSLVATFTPENVPFFQSPSGHGQTTAAKSR